MNGVNYEIQTNIVNGGKLKHIQQSALRIMKDAIVKSMGPAGSNTLILKGTNSNDLIAEYSKDGNKIINNIKFSDPISMSIQSEIEEITRYVERTVGDGTSTAVVLSSIIFDKLLDSITIPNPYELIRTFNNIVNLIKDNIKKNGRECTLDDIYDIAYISTNGNEELSSTLYDVYKEYGMDVFIDVSSSTDVNDYVKDYNGLTLETGYSDSAYINYDNNECRINHPRLYVFEDPIDTPEMMGFLEAIVQGNIFDKKASEWIPTVIVAPKISRDMNGFLRALVSHLSQYTKETYSQKPPICIISNVNGIDANHLDHISTLCGCTKIRKYIDPTVQKKEQEEGKAPTLDTITNFYGTLDEMIIDATSSKFINPSLMYEKDKDGMIITDEEGKFVTSTIYKGIITFLETEYKKVKESGEDLGICGSLKRQLNALKVNMIELFIGGITVSDRESKRDLVEDAVLNCRSAAANGVGFGANYEGYIASDISNYPTLSNKEKSIMNVINSAYVDTIKLLYSTIYSTIFDESKVEAIVKGFKEFNCPYNMTTNSFDKKVLTSINADINILDAIAKIITIMLTSNQAIVMTPNVNRY